MTVLIIALILIGLAIGLVVLSLVLGSEEKTGVARSLELDTVAGSDFLGLGTLSVSEKVRRGFRQIPQHEWNQGDGRKCAHNEHRSPTA